jgi:hypothetical protein
MLLRLHPDDRAKYGGPEWLDDGPAIDALNDLDFDALNAIDKEMLAVVGVGLMRMIGRLSTWSLDAVRFRLWITLRHNGVSIPLAEFKPARLLTGLDVKVQDGEAVDPPASTPSGSQDPNSATTPESQTSGSGSTRGSRARTSSSRPKSAR